MALGLFSLMHSVLTLLAKCPDVFASVPDLYLLLPSGPTQLLPCTSRFSLLHLLSLAIHVDYQLPY